MRKNKIDENILAYKRKRNLVNTLLRNTKNTYHQSLIEENANDPEMFWKSIKSIYKTSNDITSQKHHIDLENGKTRMIVIVNR